MYIDVDKLGKSFRKYVFVQFINVLLIWTKFVTFSLLPSFHVALPLFWKVNILFHLPRYQVNESLQSVVLNHSLTKWTPIYLTYMVYKVNNLRIRNPSTPTLTLSAIIFWFRVSEQKISHIISEVGTDAKNGVYIAHYLFPTTLFEII